MSKIFLGNLPKLGDETSLRQLFLSIGVEVIAIQLKNGVGIAHVADQNLADRAIETLNGATYLGSPLRVEPCTQRKNRSNKIFLRQLPSDVEWSEVEKLAAEFGEILNFNNQTGTAEAPSAIITYKTSEQATEAAEKLDKKELNGTSIKASVFYDRGRIPRKAGGGGQHRGGAFHGAIGAGNDFRQVNNSASAGLPLRMVVGARYVGAIIGQGGSNIREITRDSKARCVVDVNRGLRDQTGNVEKVINVFGTAESCSKAAIKILEVVQREAAKDPVNQGKTIEPELKLRAHNNLVGRLIGKGGSTIKKIMEETGCTIFVSNTSKPIVMVNDNHNGGSAHGVGSRSPILDYWPGNCLMLNMPNKRIISERAMFTGSPFYYHSINELSAFNLERTITIRGNLENISQAEGKISMKLRQCWENDAANAPGAVYPGMHPLVPLPQMGTPMDPYCYSLATGVPPTFVPPVPAVGGVGGRHATIPLATGVSPQAAAVFSSPGSANSGQPVCYTEVVHIWVPNNIVGALIGTKGAQIRNIMRTTGAHIRIESTKNETGENVDQPEKQDETVQQQRNQNDQHPETERRVTVTGTDHQQYRAQFWVFQRVCEHIRQQFDDIRLCTEIQVPSKLVGRIIGKGGQNVRELQRLTGAQVKIPDDAATHEEDEDTVVRIIGNFNASQAVQARVRQLVQQYHSQQGQARSLSGDRQRASNSRGVNHISETHE